MYCFFVVFFLYIIYLTGFKEQLREKYSESPSSDSSAGTRKISFRFPDGIKCFNFNEDCQTQVIIHFIILHFKKYRIPFMHLGAI